MFSTAGPPANPPSPASNVIPTSSACAQGVTHFKDIRYTDTITYGEMFMQNEYEMGRYNLDLADLETQRRRFDLYTAVSAGRPLTQKATCFWHVAVGLSAAKGPRQ